MSDVFRNGELLAEAMLKAWREFGHDMILLENGTACNAQACGVNVTYRDDAAPAAEKPLLASLTEVSSLQVPDPSTTFPMCEILKATRILKKEIGDKVWICARADQGPMDLAAQLRGIDELMMDIAVERGGRVDPCVAGLRKTRCNTIRSGADRVRWTLHINR